MKRWLPCLLLACGLFPTQTAWAEDIELNPGEDFCAAINQASPGDNIILSEGTYQGPCAINNGGEPDNPITLRGSALGDRPYIHYDGNSSNVIDVLQSHVAIEGLAFGPTNANIDAIKIKAGSHIVIFDNEFDGVGGISISANTSDSEGVSIIGNWLHDLQATGIYIGCHSGSDSCAATDVLIVDNFIDGVDSQNVGYGLEIKLDSFGTVANNVIHDTKGPGIEIFGSTDPNRVNQVYGNLVIGSRTAGTLEIGGGPANVHNNIVIDGATAGIYAYNYGGQNLVRDIAINHNTVVSQEGPAIAIASWAPGMNLELSNNAAMHTGGQALPQPIDGVPMVGNVDCSEPGACWVDGLNFDVSTSEPSTLDGAAEPLVVGPEVLVDFCENPRKNPPSVGALETQTGEMPVGPKSLIDCAADTGESESDSDTETTTSDSDTSGTTDASETDEPTTTSESDTAGPTSDGSTTTSGTDGSTASTGETSDSAAPTTSDSSNDSDGAGTGDQSDEGCSCTQTGGEPWAVFACAGLLLLRPRKRS